MLWRYQNAWKVRWKAAECNETTNYSQPLVSVRNKRGNGRDGGGTGTRATVTYTSCRTIRGWGGRVRQSIIYELLLLGVEYNILNMSRTYLRPYDELRAVFKPCAFYVNRPIWTENRYFYIQYPQKRLSPTHLIFLTRCLINPLIISFFEDKNSFMVNSLI